MGASGKGSVLRIDLVLQSEEDEDAEMAREGGGASLAPQVAPGEHYDDSSSSKEKRPTGRVVGIIRRNWRTRGYSGSLQPDRLGRPAKQGASNVLFCPVERRYPFIRIQTRQVFLKSRPSLGFARVQGALRPDPDLCTRGMVYRKDVPIALPQQVSPGKDQRKHARHAVLVLC